MTEYEENNMRKYIIISALIIIFAAIVLSVGGYSSFNQDSVRAAAYANSTPEVKALYIRSILISDIVSHGYIYPDATVSQMDSESYEAYLTFTDPMGKFSGMSFRVTVNWDGTGEPQVFGGFE